MILNDPKNGNRPAEAPECPEIAPEGRIGVTEKEKEWAAKKPARLHVPRYVFIGALAFLAFAFTVGGALYYRKNILPEKYYMRATAEFDAGNYDGAFTLYEKAAKIQPSRRDVYRNMAYTMVRKGKREEAIAYYETHLQKQPDDARAKWEAGVLYAEKKEYGRALELMEGGRRPGSGEHLEQIAEVYLLAGRSAEAADSLREAAFSSAEPEKTLAIAKKLMKMNFYRHALSAYESVIKLAPEDKRGLHGANAARAMLGIPSDPAMIITPGVSLGPVKLGSGKNAVKSVMGAPEKKTFTKINRSDVEIWSYGAKNKNRSMAVLFMGNKVREIETRYKGFKTETGLGPGNFLLEKYAGQTDRRVPLDDGRIRVEVKGGGMTFYAAGLNDAGNGARFAKLVIHGKGDKPVGESQSPWLKISW